MGYRSEVAIVVSQKCYDVLAIGNRDIISQADVYHKEDAVLIYYNDVKWYGEQVDKLMSALEQIDHEQKMYIEIGEDVTDIKWEGGFWDNPFNIGVSRFISKEL